jgi:hypothetical protein
MLVPGPILAANLASMLTVLLRCHPNLEDGNRFILKKSLKKNKLHLYVFYRSEKLPYKSFYDGKKMHFSNSIKPSR